MTDDPYAEFRAEMRARHGYCGPYRLGIAVGEKASNLPPPDYYAEQARKNYYEGVECGKVRVFSEALRSAGFARYWEARPTPAIEKD